MGNVYITGDTHGDFLRVEEFCIQNNLTADDIIVILGDAGINYYGGRRDKRLKEKISRLAPALFCVHGNHEQRPHHIVTYHEKQWHGGQVYTQDAYPNILFPKDGEIFDFNGIRAMVVGGAYSVDKWYRLQQGYKWFEDEQPSAAIRQKVETVLADHDWQIDIMLTHTCPLKYEPVEVFLKGIDQSTVDKSTEFWFDSIENRLDYSQWYCGHYHTSKVIDKIRFMFNDWILLNN